VAYFARRRFHGRARLFVSNGDASDASRCIGGSDEMKSKSKPSLVPRLRIVTGKDIAFGPGKAELLALVAKTGSIGAAAKRMDMSYMRAWSLIRTMNVCFEAPVIKTERGGHERGGAELTETGQRVLDLYRKMEKTALKAIQMDWRALRRILRD
jgi:molybdate transport system regulatory protein